MSWVSLVVDAWKEVNEAGKAIPLFTYTDLALAFSLGQPKRKQCTRRQGDFYEGNMDEVANSKKC